MLELVLFVAGFGFLAFSCWFIVSLSDEGSSGSQCLGDVAPECKEDTTSIAVSADLGPQETSEPETSRPVEISTDSGRTTPAKPRKARRWLVAVVLIIASVGCYASVRGSKVSINPIQSLANSDLQSHVDRAVECDYRNEGIKVSVYYRDAFSRSVVVFDLKEVSGTSTRLDVFRVLLDFAKEIQDNHCEAVELAFRGDSKFKMAGSYFRTLGRERDVQNPVYTIRTFPENVTTPAGVNAYPKWSGGLLGVVNKQMEEFNDLHDKWYLDDLRSVY